MSKKKNFALVSFAVGFAFLGAHLLSFWWQQFAFWLSGFLLALLVLGAVYFLFSSQLSSLPEILTVAILPCFLALSFSWFAPLLPESSFWRPILLLFFTTGYYLVLLTENLFVVSFRYKTVPLYRTAFVTGFALSLLVGFLLFSAIFSLKFAALINSFLTGGVGFLLFYHLFWSTIIAESEKKDIKIYALTAAVLIAQMGLVVSFWPLGSTLAALYLVSWLYVLGGTFQAHLRGRLFAKTAREYVAIGISAFFALLLSGGR